MQLTPLIAIHMSAALAALAIGPVVLWARKGAQARPRLHRSMGYAWVTLMVATAVSAIFIKGPAIPGIGHFGLIHLLIPLTLGQLFMAFRYLFQGNIRAHEKTMKSLYIGACLVAGAFTLMPGRFLHEWVQSVL